ncbi:MAG: acylphosphatase [Candidatus Brockarchaeota archaeon]|nr:acylphosphatase [Candidatus Brockarchaeota archaeon]
MRDSSERASLVRVEGKVQRMGYRRFVLDAAQELGISGYVRNERDGSVSIFAQGDEEKLSRFLGRIRAPEEPIVVKSFVEKPAKVNPRLKFFEMRYGRLAEELQEGFGAMEREFRDYRGEFRSFKDEFRDYRGEFENYRQEFRDFADRTDQNFKTLMDKYGEISEKLTQVLETLQRESAETRKELTRAIDTLSELVRKFVGKE